MARNGTASPQVPPPPWSGSESRRHSLESISSIEEVAIPRSPQVFRMAEGKRYEKKLTEALTELKIQVEAGKPMPHS